MTWTVERLATCASTMDEARDRAHGGAADQTAVIAEAMTAGRGQHGHSWHAPKGGLYLSFVVRDLDDPRLLSLALGTAVAEVLEVAGAVPCIHWVNDLVVDGRKIGGILVEAESVGDKVAFLLGGVGLNINGAAAEFPDGLAESAVTLQEVLGAEVCVEDLEGFLLEEIARVLQLLRDGHGDEIVEEFRRRDGLAGRPVVVTDGDVETYGVAAGVDDGGHLMVDVDGERRVFTTGSVRPA